MIQRISRIINNSVRLKAFVTSCEDFIISAKFFIIWGLGILYAIFAFIRYVLLLLNNCGLLTDIVATICGLIFCAICVVSIWIILELVALVIEIKHPISVGELEAKCIDADSRCFPRDDRQERNNASENNIEKKFYTEGVQNTQPSFHNAMTLHKLSKSLNNKEYFVRSCAESRLPSSRRKQKSRHQFRTDRSSTSAQRYKSVSFETKKSALNFPQRLEQRSFSSSFVSSTAPNEQKPLNIRPLYKLHENSTSGLLDNAKGISEFSSMRNRIEYSKNSAPELLSLLLKKENPFFKRKDHDQPNTSVTIYENRCSNSKKEKHFGGNQTELGCDETSSKEKFSSNLEVGEPFDDSSAELTATASEGDSSMTEDSPTKIHYKSVQEDSKSTFSSKLCATSCGNICTIHSKLGSKIKNGDVLETIAGSKRKQSICVLKDSDSAVNPNRIDIQITDSTNDSNTNIVPNESKKRGTSFEVETTSTSDTKAKKSFSCNELVPSEAITNDELIIKNVDVFKKTKRSKEKPTALVQKNFDFATNTTCINTKLVASNKDGRTANLNQNVKTGSSFDVERMVATGADSKASFSCNKSAPSENKAETAIFQNPTTTTETTIPTSSVQKRSAPDTSMSPSHISKLEALTSNLNLETLTKLADSKTHMSTKYKRSLSSTLGESQNASSLKRKYESSSSDGSSDNSSNGSSNKRKAKRRTKSCFSGDKHDSK